MAGLLLSEFTEEDAARTIQLAIPNGGIFCSWLVSRIQEVSSTRDANELFRNEGRREAWSELLSIALAEEIKEENNGST